MNRQQQIVDNVRSRGYRDGWSRAEFAGRQVAKLAEELAELAWECSILDDTQRGCCFQATLQSLGDRAKGMFDRWPEKGTVAIHPARIGAVLEELADLQVIVCSLADALGEKDIVGRAVEKSKGDVERGVR